MINNNNKHSLVVEGGAMRGIFAAGVLDEFLAQRYQPFTNYFGVSAQPYVLLPALITSFAPKDFLAKTKMGQSLGSTL